MKRKIYFHKWYFIIQRNEEKLISVHFPKSVYIATNNKNNPRKKFKDFFVIDGGGGGGGATRGYLKIKYL